MKTPSEMVVQYLKARCTELKESLLITNCPGFRLLSTIGEGDITEAYRRGLREELVECRRELAAWEASPRRRPMAHVRSADSASAEDHAERYRELFKERRANSCTRRSRLDRMRVSA